MDGVIVVDKPRGWTSHDVVNKVRRLTGTRRVGHLGTLDPSATGVLPLVVGRATRLSQFYTRNDKVYDAVIHFGYATDTYDAEGTPIGEPQPFTASRDELDRLLDRFRGEFQQVPPPVSAKKIAGTPAYKLARKKIEVTLEPITVTTSSVELVSLQGADARVKVHCSGGTYLRSIAHDLGRLLGCGAHLHELRRLTSGDFVVDDAHTLEELQQLAADGLLDRALVPMERMLPAMPAETVDNITASQIRQGRDFRVSPFRIAKGARYVKALTDEGSLIAIGEVRLPNLYHPILVL